MPHATANGASTVPEDTDFDSVMQQLNGPYGSGEGSFDFMSRELEPGEKADDAIDYEDIDDEDLPEEEDQTNNAEDRTNIQKSMKEGEDGNEDELWLGPNDLGLGKEVMANDLEGDDNLRDLFGDEPSTPPPGQEEMMDDLFFEDVSVAPAPAPSPTDLLPPIHTDNLAEADIIDKASSASPTEEEMDPATLRDYKLQQALFAMSAFGPDNPPAPPGNMEELLASLWPAFDREALPRFLELLPNKKAYFVGKQPLKPPKSIQPTKIHLDFAQDQERIFRTGGQANKRALESDHPGFVPILSADESEQSAEEDSYLESDIDEVLPGGVTMQDLRVLCADWDVKSEASQVDLDAEPATPKNNLIEADEDDWLFEQQQHQPPAKKRRIGRDPEYFLALQHIDLPPIEDPESATAKIGKRVMIDMNDRDLLLDTRPEAVIPKSKTIKDMNRDEMDINTSKRLSQRYNISNDEAYDMLKENHQNKVRGTLGNVAVEHSMPALRLQWPYYKTELSTSEARSYHRPALSFRPYHNAVFRNTTFIKRKHQRGKEIKALYPTTKSLSMGDNSSIVLLEYSEEVPVTLSNFGMASRIVNYYRRKNSEDSARPKAEIGETVVLLPQDKSPFSIFGHIDPGEITMSITNTMFRAPLFQHNPKSTDFLVVRSSTGSGGSEYYMRNIEHVFVAGQQFPSLDVPGPHSRKVTTVAKNRLKMLTFRLMKKSPDMQLSIPEITAHLPGSTDMQNRQKMKDFVHHDKDTKKWVPRDSVAIPDSETIRSWITPEDVCLLESMQVGQQHLQDTGFSNDADKGGDDDEEAEGESFEQQMAPWRITRNFLQASQGKAMLKLHGEGDPTGRGEGFSFIKTSMKGGFKAIGESVEDKLDAQRLKELGGHSYNVARQQKSYETSIRRIWDAQKASLSSTVEASDIESDIDNEEEEDYSKPTPRSEAPTPSAWRRDDESVSQFSRFSASNTRGKVLKITRSVKDEKGNFVQKEQLVWDPRVIRKYTQRRYSMQARETKLVFLIFQCSTFHCI